MHTYIGRYSRCVRVKKDEVSEMEVRVIKPDTREMRYYNGDW
jgi:hypothetical protein